MSLDDVSCQECMYYHRLKHNFSLNNGFTESHCCDVTLHLEDGKGTGWVQEVAPTGRCEFFTEGGD